MKTYVFDIDGTICTKSENKDYEDSLPLNDRIEKVNILFDAGNEIIFFTARGMARNEGNSDKCYEEFYELTNKQLMVWGVKYHKLILGKPAGDLYIDDKAISDINFFGEIHE